MSLHSLENPFRPPLIKVTDTEADVALMTAMLGKEAGEALRKLREGQKRTSEPAPSYGLTPEEQASLDRKLKARENRPPLERAREIMGKDFFGPAQVLEAWNTKLETSEIPPIPYSQTELKEAKARGEMLILRIEKDSSGQALDMNRMKQLMKEKLQGTDQIEIFRGWTDWSNEKFDKEAPRVPPSTKARWALVSKEVLEDSTSKTYAMQTKVLRDHLIETLHLSPDHPDFKGADDANLDRLYELAKADATWKQAALELSKLPINQNYRRTPSEVAYDLLTTFAITKERLLPNHWDWTNSLRSDGSLVHFGSFGAGGADVSADLPRYSFSTMGVVSSR